MHALVTAEKALPSNDQKWREAVKHDAYVQMCKDNKFFLKEMEKNTLSESGKWTWQGLKKKSRTINRTLENRYYS